MSQGSGFKAISDYVSTTSQSYYYTLLCNLTQHATFQNRTRLFFFSEEEIENAEFRDERCLMLENTSDYHNPCEVYCHKDQNKLF